MPKTYKIREGFSFVFPDGTVKTGGATVELEDDVYEQHAHKLEPEGANHEAGSVPIENIDAPTQEQSPVASESNDQPPVASESNDQPA